MFKTYHLPTVIFGAVTTIIVQSQPILAALSAEQISEIAEKITVRILTPGSPGSGIIIGKNGNIYKVLTARHVIKSINPGEESDVETFDGELHAINTRNIQTFGENWDLAVVEFTSDKTYQVGKFGDSSTLKRGKTVYVAGFPIATVAINIPILSFTEGKLAAVTSRPFEDGYGLVYDNKTLPGMSGGVVLDENGKIVGVHGKADTDNTQGTDDPTIRIKTGFNLAIPINLYLGLTKQIVFNPDANKNSAFTADDYYTQGNQKYNQKDYQGAISLFDQAITLNPNYANAYINRGSAYYNLQKYPEANADYTKAIDLNPQDDLAYYNRGITYYILQKYPEALADYAKAIKLNPQYADAYNNRGNVHSELQKYPEAINDYSQAIKINPSGNAMYYFGRGLIYSNLKKYPEAIADFSQCIALKQSHSNFDYSDEIIFIRRAKAYLELKKYPEALADYSKAIELNPDYADNYLHRADIYVKLGKYSEALADYSKAIELNPDSYALAHINRGNVYVELKKYSEAIADYSQAIEIYPQYAEAYYNRGITYANLQKYPEARRDYQQAANLYQQQGNNSQYQEIMNLLNQLPR